MKLTNDVSEKNEELVSFSEELIAMDEDLQQKIESLNAAMKNINDQKQFTDDIFQNSNTCILTWGLDGEVLDINNHFTELMGYDRQDIIGKKWYEILLPEEQKYKYYELTSKLESDRKVQNYENKALAKDGRIFDLLWNNILIYNPQNDLTIVVSFGIDLTMQKQNERRIYELAYNDKLTGFKNLIAFENDINSKINKKTSFTFLGMTVRHERKDMTRALLEGVCYSLRDCYELMHEVGINPKEIIIKGGGAKNDFWCQMLADVLHTKIKKLDINEGPALGAAILASVGDGKYSSVSNACQDIIKTTKEFTPDEVSSKIYSEKYKKYKSLYPMLKDFFSSL